MGRVVICESVGYKVEGEERACADAPEHFDGRSSGHPNLSGAFPPLSLPSHTLDGDPELPLFRSVTAPQAPSALPSPQPP